MYKMYSDLASWWPLVSQPSDYAAEAAFFIEVFRQAGLDETAALLELGCGGGNNASFLKKAFASLTLTDLSPRMLAVSRALNPQCAHALGDMRALRLGRTFDGVFVHDAVMYMTSAADLLRALETAAIHCKPGGMALFVPDHTRETFAAAASWGGEDGAGRSLRYLEWTYDPDPADTTYAVEFAYLLHEDGQAPRREFETHTFGLFARADWLRLLGEAGFARAEVMGDSYGRDLFAATR